MTTGPTAEHEIDRLVAAACGGERAALNDLLVIIRPLVVRYCRSRLGATVVSADDVAQEVCLAVLKGLPSYTDQGRPFLAFVYGIAAHKVVDAHRKAGRERADASADLPDRADDGRVDDPEARAVAGSVSAEMRTLLAELPEKQREILVLRVVVGLSAEETADAVGSTPGAVRVAQHRVLSRLRRTMATVLGQGAVAVGAASAFERPLRGTAPVAPPAVRPDRQSAWLAHEEARSDWDAAPLTGLPALDAVFAREDLRHRA